MFNESTLLQGPKELFDVRLKILRHTNPLRAKILIFSILYHPFKFSTRDWLTIKMQDLDNLIRHLYSLCPTPQVLEERLYETARTLNRQDEECTTASVIFKAMNSLYRTSQSQPLDRVLPSDHSPTPAESDLAENLRSEEAESDLDDDETQWLAPEGEHPPMTAKQLASFPAANSNQTSIGASVGAVEIDDDLTQPLFLYDLNEVSESISYESGAADSLSSPESRDNAPDLEPSKDAERLGSSKPSGSASPQVAIEANPSPANITSSLLRKMALNRDVQRLIDEQSRKVRESLVEAVRHLERECDRISMGLTPGEQLSIKYPALQHLTDTLAAHLTQLQETLTQEAESAKALTSQDASRSPNVPFQTAPAIPQTIISLLNPLLKPQGIKTFAKYRDNGLHLILESTQTLDPQKLIPFVRAALIDANLTELDRVKVYSRQPGHSSPEWIQTLHF